MRLARYCSRWSTRKSAGAPRPGWPARTCRSRRRRPAPAASKALCRERLVPRAEGDHGEHHVRARDGLAGSSDGLARSAKRPSPDAGLRQVAAPAPRPGQGPGRRARCGHRGSRWARTGRWLRAWAPAPTRATRGALPARGPQRRMARPLMAAVRCAVSGAGIDDGPRAAGPPVAQDGQAADRGEAGRDVVRGSPPPTSCPAGRPSHRPPRRAGGRAWRARTSRPGAGCDADLGRQLCSGPEPQHGPLGEAAAAPRRRAGQPGRRSPRGSAGGSRAWPGF